MFDSIPSTLKRKAHPLFFEMVLYLCVISIYKLKILQLLHFRPINVMIDHET